MTETNAMAALMDEWKAMLAHRTELSDVVTAARADLAAADAALIQHIQAVRALAETMLQGLPSVLPTPPPTPPLARLRPRVAVPAPDPLTSTLTMPVHADAITEEIRKVPPEKTGWRTATA